MCGRFALTTPSARLAAAFDLNSIGDLEPRYNIAPTQTIVAVRRGSGKNVLMKVRWGLIPAWSAEPTSTPALINARCETLMDKPSFREAVRHRRCLIPADGFYEWKTDDDRRQPWYIFRADRAPLALAGIWEERLSPEGEVLRSAAIVTTVANPALRAFHERMPVILEGDRLSRWLSPRVRNLPDLADLFDPLPESRLEMYPVSKHVNHVKVDDARCIERAADGSQPTLF